MPLKRPLLVSGIALACFAMLLLVDRFQPLLLIRLRNLERDAIAQAARTTPANPNLVFLAIASDSVTLEAKTDVKELYGLTDQNSIEARALKLMSEAWPWQREVYALVLQRLIDAGAKVVAFDLAFPTSTPYDPPFRLALGRHKNCVVIGSDFVSASSTARLTMRSRRCARLSPCARS